MEFPTKIIEVTGPPCSGKTFFIENSLSGSTVLLGGMPLSYGTVKRVICSVLLSFYAVSSRSVGARESWWLVRMSATYEETLFSRLNGFRNSLTKFGYDLYTTNGNSIVIDEGISHIPFILELRNTDIDSFIEIFHKYLKKMKIIYIQPPPADILKERLLFRGHKRIRVAKDVERFASNNMRIAQYYMKALSDSGLDITFI